MAHQLTPTGFVLRWAFALVLVLATYNPSGYSFYDLVVLKITEIDAVRALFGVLLIIGWAIYLRATLRSLGPFGVAIAGALFAVLIWLLMDFNLLPKDSLLVWQWVCLLGTATVLAIGLSWSHVRRRISGQYDDTDENA